jgi:hypothetical protein
MMLDIASVEVERPGTGVFTAILTEIEVWVRDQERLDGLFIENVLEILRTQRLPALSNLFSIPLLL